jgi:hypothetical protein
VQHKFVVVVGLLRFKVNTGKFGGNVGMGDIQFNKSLVIFKITILPVVLMPFLVEKFEGLCFVFFLVAYAPIFDDFDDPIRHGEGSDRTGFFKYTRVDVEYLVCALAIASGTKEYARECARAHSVGNGWIILGFEAGCKGGLASFLKSSSQPRRILQGEYFPNTPAAAGRLFSQHTVK